MKRLAALAAGLCLLAPVVAGATEVCGKDLAMSSPQDQALLDFAHRLKLDQPEAFRNIAEYLHADRGMGDDEWLIFVSTDHEKNFAPFAAAQ